MTHQAPTRPGRVLSRMPMWIETVRIYLEFGHFHCRVAASEGRPAFQGRSWQPNLLTRRRATDEIANPNGVRDSSAADAARIPVGHPGAGLERPAYSQAPRCGGETGVCVPNKYHLSREHLFHGWDLTTPGISIRVVVSADPNVQTLHLWNCRRSCSRPRRRRSAFGFRRRA